MSSSVPAMSVILVTPDRFDTIRETVSYLAQQTDANQLELVIVCPFEEELQYPQEFCSGFAGVHIVALNAEIPNTGIANAAGIQQATAPVIALAEDHCFPEPLWAKALIARHNGPWAAVGPVFKNANPENSVSDADLLMAYGPWLHPGAEGPMDFLPGHNSSYKRDALLQFEQRLPDLLANEFNLHSALRAAGHRLYCEPGAIVAHTNFSRWASFVAASYLSAQQFAGSRSTEWTLLKRIVYGAAAPLIPLVRLRRIALQARNGRFGLLRFLASVPALIAGLIISAAGETMGYLLGCGNSRQRLVPYEFHRYRHTVSGDNNQAAAQSQPTAVAGLSS